MYCVPGKYFADLYRNKLSGYADWREDELGCGFYFNDANIGPYMSLDETCLSKARYGRSSPTRTVTAAGAPLQPQSPERKATR